jgi:hypothetical protein
MRPVPETQAPIKSSTADAFAALDAGSTAPAHSWIQAGTHHAEAGYLDPSLGWVGVRAQTSGDSLHASILPGSGEAAQALGGHLAALNSFMADHHGPSSTVTLTSPDQAQSQSGFGHSSEGSPQQNPREQQAQGGPTAVASQAVNDTALPIQTPSHSDAQTTYKREGAHISVVA